MPLAIDWFMYALGINESQRNFIAEFYAGRNPLQCFVCVGVQWQMTLTLNSKLEILRVLCALALSTEPTHQVLKRFSATRGLEFTIDSHFER
jgi:hypothetical protein